MSETLAYTPIHVLAERLRGGDLKPTALLDVYLARIARCEPQPYALVAVYEDEENNT
jgi:Asp-tRNA(Asn)/Glu-tRNA(Gln) amidotransferase A subunit family amidase